MQRIVQSLVIAVALQDFAVEAVELETTAEGWFSDGAYGVYMTNKEWAAYVTKPIFRNLPAGGKDGDDPDRPWALTCKFKCAWVAEGGQLEKCFKACMRAGDPDE